MERSSKFDERYLARDNYTYDKENNPEIDMCLNCKMKKCSGNCSKVGKFKSNVDRAKKLYIIKRRYTTAGGIEKYGYLHGLHKRKGGSSEMINCVTEIFNAKKLTKEEAIETLARCKELSPSKITYEILLRSEEIEKTGTKNRKTKRRVPDFRVDANGNIVGKRL